MFYKDIINKSLKSRRIINKAKGKDLILIRIILSTESYIVLTFRGHINIVENLLNIKLYKDLYFINTYYYLID